MSGAAESPSASIAGKSMAPGVGTEWAGVGVDGSDSPEVSSLAIDACIGAGVAIGVSRGDALAAGGVDTVDVGVRTAAADLRARARGGGDVSNDNDSGRGDCDGGLGAGEVWDGSSSWSWRRSSSRPKFRDQTIGSR